MIQPGRIVNTLGQLPEHNEILSAEVQLFIRTAEIEAALRRQLPFRIFPLMTTTFDSGECHQECCGRNTCLGSPNYALSGFQLYGTCQRMLDALSLRNRI